MYKSSTLPEFEGTQNVPSLDEFLPQAARNGSCRAQNDFYSFEFVNDCLKM